MSLLEKFSSREICVDDSGNYTGRITESGALALLKRTRTCLVHFVKANNAVIDEIHHLNQLRIVNKCSQPNDFIIEYKKPNLLLRKSLES